MKAQYKVLGKLKRLDEKLYRVQLELEKIPEEIKKLEAKLNEHKNEFALHKANFETNEKALRKAELDLKEKEDFIKKAESKMMECKTNEEYQAAQKEIDGFKTEKSKLEEIVLTSMNGIEGHRNNLKAAETKFKDQEAVVNREKKEYEEVRQKLLRSYEEQGAQKDGIVAQLSPDVATTYRKAFAATKGVAICLADNSSCVGCNMKVRPQLFNEILGAKAIHRCPSCGRILITASSEIDENPGADVQI
ncbi:MAG: hypothetical protein EBR01_05930 [Proteobacteria bacterium]|nr:hypothetical protein [Pseudomonadota bacterium]NBY18870.1 hypothetical protein [bacterium]